MEFRVGHLAYLTNDMSKTLPFYTEMLGFRHIFSLPHPETGKPWIEYVMTPDGRFIELFHPEEGMPTPDGSYMHLCLEVDDCAAAVAELERKGVTIRIPIKRGRDDNLQAWIRDPDGRDIELMQLSPASGQFRARASLTK